MPHLKDKQDLLYVITIILPRCGPSDFPNIILCGDHSLNFIIFEA